jgi:DNA-directed RNA polymerase subunit alpha
MSKVIHNPALASVDEHSATSASFVIEPLQAGYGNTLGNSVRRVLLSSIKGAAIVAFRIEGSSHEFTTVPGVKEDVVDIMLNLKNIKVKVFTDEPIELRLEKKGTGVITAGDIKTKSSQQLTTQRSQSLWTSSLNLAVATKQSKSLA